MRFFLSILFFSFCIPRIGARSMENTNAFEVNEGQVSGQIDGSPIRFVLKATNSTCFFSDRGYSVVHYQDSLSNNRTDFLFTSNDSYSPSGEALLASMDHHYLNDRIGSAKKYERIVYHDIGQVCDLEFSIHGDSLVKKLIIRSYSYYFSFAFEVRGSNVSPLSEENKTGYVFTNEAGSFSEVALNHDPLLQVSNVIGITQRKENDIQPVYFLHQSSEVPMVNSSISWLTYLGGNSSDELFGIIVTPDSGAVVVGRSGSIDFPSSVGAFQDTLGGSYDAVVTRFDGNGNCLWSTYYGGTGFDGAYAVIRIDTLYAIVGMTQSTDLPMMNATQPNNAGGYDGFILLLDDSGQMVRSTFYGGTGGEQIFSLALDTSGRIVVAGSATSASLPFSNLGYQPALAGAIDAFLAVFDLQLQPIWSTFYGGSGSEDIHSVTVTPQGEIVFVGGTFSNGFPTTAGAYQTGMISTPDCYLVKFGMDGLRHYATLFGGSNTEDCNSIVADSSGSVYVTGFSYSMDFPIMGNTFQSLHAAQSDVYVIKFDPNGQPVWSTFIGGNGVENGYGIERKGKYIFICGDSESSDFPVSPIAIQNSYATNGDGFVVKFDTTGSMVTGTYMGGNGVDGLYGITITADTSVITCGTTYSTNLSVTPGAFQMTNHTQGDGFVVKFGMAEQLLSNSSVDPAVSDSEQFLFPNPASGMIFFSDPFHTCQIYSIEGKLVAEYKGDQIKSMDISTLAVGSYIVHIENEQGRTSVLLFQKN